ncbi:hypothetical protein VTK73DRAFT_7680 [Phialemonium thermophilum]|uniref:SHSP domain-containing protein n=1 Tax=Phialemonium thermophilum TaxID=223376 RepID=A0ABR3Y6H2_9PEZI
MSLFPRTFYDPDVSFTPLFRLLDDFDNYTREVQGNAGGEGRRGRGATRFVNPKFDVRETENTYELHGELPGVERENLNIEFTEPQTLVISGRIERSYSSGTPPAGFVEDSQKKGAITEGGEKGKEAEAGKTDQQQQQQQQQPREKYWVSERSVGEFSRTFSFPTPVDHDGVKAGLNNGILNVSVPKAKKKEVRRIAIN